MIRRHEERFLRRALDAVAGRARASRSSATSTRSGCRSCRSWCVRPSGKYLHHNFVVALLNDLFGIQSRGGCSCAGPYGHRLLGIDLERSHEFEREITRGLRGHQARLGAGQLQLLHLRGGLRLHRRGRATGGAGRLADAGRVPLRRRSRASGCTATDSWSRRCGWARSPTTPDGAMQLPAACARPPPESALADYLAESAAAAPRPPRRPRASRSPTWCRPTSSTSGGSTSRRRASSSMQPLPELFAPWLRYFD